MPTATEASSQSLSSSPHDLPEPLFAPRWYGRGVWWVTVVPLGLICLIVLLAADSMFPRAPLWGAMLALGLIFAGRLWGGCWLTCLSDRHYLVVVMSLALAARLACVLVVPYSPTDDFEVYHVAGQHMARDWELRVMDAPPSYLETPGIVEPGSRTGRGLRCFFPPGQVFALGVLYRLFGDGPGFRAAQILNVVWGTLTVAGVWYLGSAMFGALTGRLAALLAALLPSTIAACVVIGAEVPQNFWFVLALCLYLGLLERRGKLWAALACGVCLGIASLIRPTFVLFGAALALHTLLSWGGRRRRALAAAVLIVLGIALIVLPWTWRNYRVTGGFILISSNAGGNLYSGNNDWTEGQYTEAAWGYVYRNAPDDLSLQRIGMEKGLEWIASHPGRFCRLAFQKFILFWHSDADMTRWAVESFAWRYPDRALAPVRRDAAMAFTSWYFAALILASLIGLIRHRRALRRDRAWMLVPVACVYFTGVHMVFESQAKYHYPLTPLVCILAALAALAAGVLDRTPRTDA